MSSLRLKDSRAIIGILLEKEIAKWFYLEFHNGYPGLNTLLKYKFSCCD